MAEDVKDREEYPATPQGTFAYWKDELTAAEKTLEK